MTLQPSTATQVAEKSILDIFERQTYLGNSFILPFPAKALADQLENPICVISNPSTSGKGLFLFNRKAISDNNVVLLKFYLNPTLNVPGSTTTPVNCRTGSAFTSVSRCYLAASITSNGTFISTLPATQYGLTSDLMLILDPGKSLLVTATQQTSTGPTNVFLENAWYEI